MGRFAELITASTNHALQTVSGLRKGRTEARETQPIKPVPDDVVENTLPHLSDVVADMVRFHRITGCRPEEVCKIRPCDIERTDDVWQYRPHSHKTEHHERTRMIFIEGRAQAVLRNYLERDPQMHCFRPCESEAKRRAAAQPLKEDIATVRISWIGRVRPAGCIPILEFSQLAKSSPFHTSVAENSQRFIDVFTATDVPQKAVDESCKNQKKYVYCRKDNADRWSYC